MYASEETTSWDEGCASPARPRPGAGRLPVRHMQSSTNVRICQRWGRTAACQLPFNKVYVMEKKRITTLFLIVLADMAGASAILPIIPVYVLGQFHATPFQAALVIPGYFFAPVRADPRACHPSPPFCLRPILLVR